MQCDYLKKVWGARINGGPMGSPSEVKISKKPVRFYFFNRMYNEPC